MLERWLQSLLAQAEGDGPNWMRLIGPLVLMLLYGISSWATNAKKQKDAEESRRRIAERKSEAERDEPEQTQPQRPQQPRPQQTSGKRLPVYAQKMRQPQDGPQSQPSPTRQPQQRPAAQAPQPPAPRPQRTAEPPRRPAAKPQQRPEPQPARRPQQPQGQKRPHKSAAQIAKERQQAIAQRAAQKHAQRRRKVAQNAAAMGPSTRKAATKKPLGQLESFPIVTGKSALKKRKKKIKTKVVKMHATHPLEVVFRRKNPLAQGILMSEILGKPRALNAEIGPTGY